MFNCRSCSRSRRLSFQMTKKRITMTVMIMMMMMMMMMMMKMMKITISLMMMTNLYCSFFPEIKSVFSCDDFILCETPRKGCVGKYETNVSQTVSK